MFKVTGKIDGQEETLTYENTNGHGRVSGGEMAMFLLQNALERNSPVGPVGQYMNRDLNEPLAAFFMMLECFQEVTNCEGDYPVAAEVPDGAIG